MKPISLFILAISATFCSLHANDNTIIALTSADNPPYEYVKSGEIVGFDIDLAKEIAKEIGRKIEFKDISFSGFVPALLAGHGDCAIAAISPTNARSDSMDFSDPYFENRSAIVLLGKDKFSNVSNDAVFPLKLLENKTIGVQLGTHHEIDIAGSNVPGIKIRRYDYMTSMIAEMRKSSKGVGDLYAIIVGVPEAESIVRKNSDLMYYKMEFIDSCAIAFPKKSKLVDDFNAAIKRLKSNGTIKALEQKWGISK